MTFDLKNFDFLGINPILYVESQRRKKSTIGGLASVFSIILFAIIFFYFFLEVLFRNSFLLVYNQTTDFFPALNLTNIPMAIGVFDSQINSLNLEGQVRLFGEFIEIKSSSNENKTIVYTKQFKLEKCNISSHFGNYAFLFQNFPVEQNFYCFPINKINFTLYGNWGDSLHENSFLLIKIAKCFNTNDTEIFPYEKCQDASMIDKNFFRIYLNTLFLDYDLNHNNYENPAKLILRSETFQMSSTVFNSYFIKKKIVEYQTDSGFFSPNIKKKFYFQDDNISHYTDLRGENSSNGVFGNLNISLSKKTDHFFRTYVKLQTALANIGGLIEGMFFICSIVTKYLMNKFYFLDLGKKCYNFSDKTYEIINSIPFKLKDFGNNQVIGVRNKLNGKFNNSIKKTTNVSVGNLINQSINNINNSQQISKSHLNLFKENREVNANIEKLQENEQERKEFTKNLKKIDKEKGKNNIFNISEKRVIPLYYDQENRSLSKIIKIQKEIKQILFNNYIFSCKSKNLYFEKLEKIIRGNLSIENILIEINSISIIKNILKEKRFFEGEEKPNFFDIIKIQNYYFQNNNLMKLKNNLYIDNINQNKFS